ncbi:MAG: hypothetical protein RJA44_2040 [Pseudomonadota bacterium]
MNSHQPERGQPYSDAAACGRLVGHLTRGIIGGILLLYIIRQLLVPQAVTSTHSTILLLLAIPAALMIAQPWQRLVQQPGRLLGSVARMTALMTLLVVFTAWARGWISLWIWPWWGLSLAALGGALMVRWPRHQQHIIVGAMLTLVLSMTLCSVLLFTGHGEVGEATLLARTWVYTSTIGLIGLLGLEALSSRPTPDALRLRFTVAAIACALLGLTFTSLIYPTFQNHSQVTEQMPWRLLLISTVSLSVVLMLVRRLRLLLPALILLLWSMLNAVSLWKNGTLALPGLTHLAVLSGLLLPARRWWLSALLTAALLTEAALLPGIDLTMLVMHGTSAVLLLAGALRFNRMIEAQLATTASDMPLPATDVDEELSPALQRSSLQVGLAVAGLVLAGGLAMVAVMNQHERERLHGDARQALQANARLLARALAGIEHLTHLVAADAPRHVSSQADFEIYASRLGRFLGSGLAIQWAPAGVVRYVYPFDDHEGHIGHDLLNAPDLGTEAREIVSTRRARWSGPYTLRQGGLGLIFRVPVFAADGRFSGFASTVLHIPLGLSEQLIGNPHYRLRLRSGPRPDQLIDNLQAAEWGDNPDVLAHTLYLYHSREGRVDAGDPVMPWILDAAPDAAPAEADLWFEMAAETTSPSPAQQLPGRIQAVFVMAALLGWLTTQGLRQRHLAQRQALQRQEYATLHEVMSHSLTGKVLFNAAGQVVWINARAIEIFQVDQPHVMAFNCFEHALYRREGWDVLARQTLEDGQTRTVEYRGPGDIGQPLDIQRTFNRILLGREPHLLLQVLDLTEQHRLADHLREQQQRLQDLIDGTQAGTWELDLHSGIATWNATGASMLGYGPDELVPLDGDARRQLSHPQDRSIAWRALERHLAGQTDHLRVEQRLRHKDAHWVWVLMRGRIAARDAEGRPLRISGIMLDISALKDNETALIAAKEAAETANIAKSQFLSMMGHEIRTPINGIMGMLQVLQWQFQQDAATSNRLAQAMLASEHLLDVLNDVLDFSAIEAGKMQIENTPFQLDKVVAEASQICQRRKREACNYITDLPRNLPLHLVGDPHRLRQVLINLVGNALKFTERGQVRLRIRQLERKPSHVKLGFSVSDTGIGIAESDQKLLFQPFTQADMTITRRFGGTGLGLTISRRIVRAMGGDIHLDSVPGQGSTFSFVLSFGLQPEVEATEAFDQSWPARTARLQGLRLLLVEDDPINQEAMQLLLPLDGARVDLADTGTRAIQMGLAGQPYDAVLMDLQMPDMSGIDATRELRARGYRAPIIALTANAFAEYEQACHEAGMDDYLAKPIHIDRLVEVIRKHLRPLD